MNLQTRKIAFVQEFLRLQNESVIGELEKTLRSIKVSEIENSMFPVSIEQFNKEIDQSLLDSKNDKVISSQNLKKKIKKWA
jgi:hypothetical protein